MESGNATWKGGRREIYGPDYVPFEKSGRRSEGRDFDGSGRDAAISRRDRELLKFIAQSIKYPTDAQEAGVQGRVICSFVVDKKGNIVEPKIIRGIDPSLDAEALRVIGMMPRWTPGRQDGKAVRVLYTVPITFRLQ